MTMDQVREHPWITEKGDNPLITKDENCYDVIEEITEKDLNAAIKPVASVFTVVSYIFDY